MKKITRYQCLNCGWIGTEEEMDADYYETGDDECWSNWICPRCHIWYQLKDYKMVES